VGEFLKGGVGLIGSFRLSFITSHTEVPGSVPILGYGIGTGPDVDYSVSSSS